MNRDRISLMSTVISVKSANWGMGVLRITYCEYSYRPYLCLHFFKSYCKLKQLHKNYNGKGIHTATLV